MQIHLQRLLTGSSWSWPAVSCLSQKPKLLQSLNHFWDVNLVSHFFLTSGGILGIDRIDTQTSSTFALETLLIVQEKRYDGLSI